MKHLIVALLLAFLAGCASSAPLTQQEASIRMLASTDPVLRQIGFVRVAQDLDRLPQENRRRIIAEMITNPLLHDAGMRYFYAEMGLTPSNYPGNCPTPYDTDAAGHRCGARSALSRPGGY